MKFSIKGFFSKCDQIRRKLRIWSYLLKKSLMKNFIFCAVSTFLKISAQAFGDKDFLAIFLRSGVFDARFLIKICDAVDLGKKANQAIE